MSQRQLFSSLDHTRSFPSYFSFLQACPIVFRVLYGLYFPQSLVIRARTFAVFNLVTSGLPGPGRFRLQLHL